MGVQITYIKGYYEFSKKDFFPEEKEQVFLLAKKVLDHIIDKGLPEDLSHILVATTCPDMLSPSLGQLIKEYYIDYFSNCLSLDIVQGCAGGVTAMIMGSQIAESSKTSVLIINADAARKATSKSSSIHGIFGNGSFACLLSSAASTKRLIHYKSVQYKGLSNVVTVNLGHDADAIIKSGAYDIKLDPRKHLGLSLNKVMALKLYNKAERFYNEFVNESGPPDIMILHQVNPLIMKHLESSFEKYGVQFINVIDKTGNCGAASVGIALDIIKKDIENKKLMLCSFGTGGVITAGLWQC